MATKKPTPKAAKSAAKKVTKPVAKKAAKPASKKEAKPVAKKAAKPAPKKEAKPAAKKAAKPASKKEAKPAAKKAAKPAPKKVAKPAAKKALKPIPKKVEKPMAKKAAKSVDKKVVKPTAPVKPAPNKAEKPSPVAKTKPIKENAPPAPVQAAPPVPASQKPKGRTVVVKQAEIGSITSIGIQMATGIARPRKKKNKEDDARMEQLFEQTQAAPKGLAAKIEEAPVPIPSDGHYSTPEPVKPKANVRYSDKELKEFSTVIHNEREKTLDELRMLKERLEDLTNYESSEETAVYSMHMAEQGSEAVEREKTYAQIQRMTDYLRKLEDAAKRIEDKTYGICRQCGILIAKQRLLAVPITTLSASWKLHQRCPVDGIDRVGKQ